jgi:hypothetical protein
MQLSRNRGVYRACRRCLALLILLLAACRADAELLPQQAAPTPTPLPPEPAVEQPTYMVQRGAVTRELGFTARVAPVQEAQLFFRTAGYVSRLHAQRGDRVSAGDVLAELAMADLQRQLAGARLELAQAEIASRRAILKKRSSSSRIQSGTVPVQSGPRGGIPGASHVSGAERFAKCALRLAGASAERSGDSQPEVAENDPQGIRGDLCAFLVLTFSVVRWPDHRNTIKHGSCRSALHGWIARSRDLVRKNGVRLPDELINTLITSEKYVLLGPKYLKAFLYG